MATTRRDFLRIAPSALAAAGVLHPALSWAGSDEVYVPGKEGMIVRSARFLDLEMPMEVLKTWITPAPHFFVRNHMHEPSTLDASTWALTISGEVENPLTLSLADLKRLEPQNVVNTLECAGNGRAFQQPHVPGVQWERGAVGTARFSGPRLRDLLRRAGVKSTGKHVMFRGLDEVPGKVPAFIRSIPIEKATDADTLVALEMNSAPLAKQHGFPARALVPGWIGAASCKWLTEIKVLDKEFEGNFMKPGYRFPNQPVQPGADVNPDDTHPITALSVKSIIAAPIANATLRSRAVHIHGAAWAGEADVTRVDVSTDGGSTWQPAQLGREQSKYAWRLWSYSWHAPRSGEYTILSRATDSQSRVQPASAAWNPSGYLYNAIDRVKIHVET
ncbi:MAG TPA: sulfite oxidase [Terriglobales bacterium]|nr:sulfite oxidase [Terriglobales bacterium]